MPFKRGGKRVLTGAGHVTGKRQLFFSCAACLLLPAALPACRRLAGGPAPVPFAQAGPAAPVWDWAPF